MLQRAAQLSDHNSRVTGRSRVPKSTTTRSLAAGVVSLGATTKTFPLPTAKKRIDTASEPGSDTAGNCTNGSGGPFCDRERDEMLWAFPAAEPASKDRALQVLAWRPRCQEGQDMQLMASAAQTRLVGTSLIVGWLSTLWSLPSPPNAILLKLIERVGGGGLVCHSWRGLT